MSILVAKKFLGHFLIVTQLPAHVCSIPLPATIFQFFLIRPSDERGVAREQIVPKTQGPTNVSKTLRPARFVTKNLCAPVRNYETH